MSTETRANCNTITALHDAFNGRRVLPELVGDEIVYVATDLNRDGCIAQAATYEEAIVALDEARELYDSVRRTPTGGRE